MLILLLVVVFIYLFVILGETYVLRNENTKFGKWWRRNICSPDPLDL
jgi:hypothetical protein